jgi:hypothetical protein
MPLNPARFRAVQSFAAVTGMVVVLEVFIRR